MTIRINKDKCVGCKCCTNICPGNLIYMEDKKAYIKFPDRCWGCTACLKECNQEAIELFMYGQEENFLTLKENGDEIKWKIHLKDKVLEYETNRNESNKY